MKTTISIQDHDIHLKDDAGNSWGVGESAEYRFCDGCGRAITVYFVGRDRRRNTRMYRCTDCVEVVNPYANGGRGEIIGSAHHPE